MTEQELQAKAVREIASAVGKVPPEPRVVYCEAETEWNEELLRNLSEHKLHVLARGADIVVFFDKTGREIGWRDDGRIGTAQPRPFARDALREMIVLELELPATARLGTVQTRELPPLGWTHEALVYLAAVPAPEQMVRVWVSPDDYRVIQCLYGPFGAEGPQR
jgi:hypothetical protein